MSTGVSVGSVAADLSWEVRANDRLFHRKQQRRSCLCLHRGRYSDNVIRSYKYSALTFLPLSLFEQFQRIANIYFLCIVVLQSIPAISTLPWYTTMIPLLTVLSVRGFKDLADDLARRRSDSQINRQPCDLLTNEGFTSVQWKDVCVGDVLRLHKDQTVPADLLLLSTTEPHSLCYIETSDIDGETNLKIRQALAVTHQELSSDPIEPSLLAFDGRVWCEEPNSHLHSFKGVLEWRDMRHLLDTGHILLRGTVLRNTRVAYGLTIYTGLDSKILQNCGQTAVKTTQVERTLNKVVVGIVLLVLLVALLLSVGAGIFEDRVAPSIEVLAELGGRYTPIYKVFLTFWGYIILLSPSMPMSLYITFELVHVIHSLFIGWDLDLYDGGVDVPAHARSTTLNEELGQVRYLLSDKTGTLTENRLIFRQCCIAGILYGNMPDKAKKHDTLDLSWNPFSCGGLQFSDKRLVDTLRKPGCPEVREFFKALALCHTVMAEWKEGAPVYQAASPDEEALVGAARELGWVFLSRTRDSMTLSELGHRRQYELLALLDFTSQRRRMSVLVRDPEGELKLYCKGADIVILERLRKDTTHCESTEKALEVFSQGCLRTLCVAVRSVQEGLWEEWSRALEQAAMTTGASDDLYDNMERELTLLGVTAIEDQLQVGVPETIATLRQAGIKVWVLTGDKKETAVNIGFACRLLDPDTRLLQGEELRQLLQTPSPEIPLNGGQGKGKGAEDRTSAMVITGPELVEFEEQPELGKRFIALSRQCQAVLCCRTTPSQKAGVVQLIRKYTSSVTMAIGDGANDVNMIKTAHIGVGLNGLEGGQAVQNADFSLAKFHFLRKLLLVHGRWSYRRISVFLRYFLYKTSSFAFVHIWFAFCNGFSGQPMYESWFITLYTILYTSFPVQCLAVFEQDVSAEGSLRWPSLYQVGVRRQLFNPRLLAATFLYSIYTSLVLFFIPLSVFRFSAIDFQTFSVTVATASVFTSTTELILQTGYWTMFSAAAVVFSMSVYFLATLILHSPLLHKVAPADFYFLGAFQDAFANPLVWLTVLLTTCTAVLPSLTARALVLVLNPPDTHRVHSSDGAVQTERHLELRSAFRRGHVHRRSSYAVSQGPGFGWLITSGVALDKTPTAQNDRVDINKIKMDFAPKMQTDVPQADHSQESAGCGQTELTAYAVSL
ncbi:phospholipid-transporting ATPase IC isoform X1 [Brienomyrus brachyistius]|uniref:phospholipid-transporting ATPase IC isoform X1 n=1 Tax=Brienomyrus brachyistius TaxID=42636 RepID=UPI0020B25C80|nr:phospholipid-transporting ATPase IC isoform X1 [Brienomyrus brachyistius]